MDLKWLNELIQELPKTSASRRNLIEIAGYPRWENVNSNLLAFYFDEKEEHGFGRLFINSLIDLCETKFINNFDRELFDSEFSVDREVVTSNGRRIDIVINEDSEDSNEEDSASWSIIIENKIDAKLYNKLNDYWNLINNKRYGIVLSVENVTIDSEYDGKYVNILHKELIDKVQNNLTEYYLESDDRHLLFLKEYISNVRSYYKNKTETMELNESIKLFNENKKNIEEFKKMDIKLLKWISEIVFPIFRNVGFSPSSTKTSSKYKHFQADKNLEGLNNELKENLDYTNKFRCWINLSQLRYESIFIASFELYGKENTRYGDRLKSVLQTKNVFTDFIKEGTNGSSSSGYQHILKIDLPIKGENGFDVELKETICKNIFKSNVLNTVVLELKTIIEEEKHLTQQT